MADGADVFRRRAGEAACAEARVVVCHLALGAAGGGGGRGGVDRVLGRGGLVGVGGGLVIGGVGVCERVLGGGGGSGGC